MDTLLLQLIMLIIAYGLFKKRPQTVQFLADTLDTQKQIKCVNIYFNDV